MDMAEPSECCLVVLGSLNSKIADRSLDRNEVIPVQFVVGEKIEPIRFFNDFGELGVSSMQFFPEIDKMFFSTGADLYVIDINNHFFEELEVPGLVDVHEMSTIGGSLWLANTGRNEAIEIDPKRNGILSRKVLRGKQGDNELDKFHCNQIFRDLDGVYWGLVHHVGGRQIVNVVRGKLVKSQGDGGLRSIFENETKNLRLNGPHTIRQIEGEYWVFSSGEQTIKRYDQNWVFIDSILTMGWGRGGEYCANEGIYYSGISPIRKRYAGIVKASTASTPQVEKIDVKNKCSIGSFEIPNVEQINNIYSVPIRIVQSLQNIQVK